MKKLIILLVILAGYLFLSAQALSQSKLFSIGAKETVMVVNPENENSGGTGFAVRAPSGKLYTLTNAHVCSIAKDGAMLAKYEGKKIRLQVISVSETTDLCLLSALPEKGGLEIGKELGMYEGVYLVGHPMLQPISIAAGWVRGRGEIPVGYCEGAITKVSILPEGETRSFKLDALDDLLEAMSCVKYVDSIITNNFSLPGNSGSPVLNEDGKVIGVLFAGDGRSTSLIVPLDRVQDFLAGF